jgi:uncharacterized membrane protein
MERRWKGWPSMDRAAARAVERMEKDLVVVRRETAAFMVVWLVGGFYEKCEVECQGEWSGVAVMLDVE